ncbi:MAG: hypothetical protein V1720_07595 [bacterium]
MKKILFVISSLLICLSGCELKDNPADSNPTEIKDSAKSYTIDVPADSLIVESSPVYEISYSDVPTMQYGLSGLKYYYPEEKMYNVDREFVIAVGDSFTIKINHCVAGNKWQADKGTIIGPSPAGWDNDEVAALNIDSINSSTGNLQRVFKFKALKKSKGYISLIETDASGISTSGITHELLIGYNCVPLSQVQVNITEIKWIYNTSDNSFSTVSVKLKGTTNVYRLRGIAHGDGEISAFEIPVDTNKTFTTQYTVAFSHISGTTLTTNSELILYGTVGIPKVISLINPQNK